MHLGVDVPWSDAVDAIQWLEAISNLVFIPPELLRFGRQFLTEYEPKGYSEEVKRLCLKMYVNGMGVRGISRVTDIAHTTILNWIEQSGKRLPESYDPKQHPQVGKRGHTQNLRSSTSTISYGFGLRWITLRREL